MTSAQERAAALQIASLANNRQWWHEYGDIVADWKVADTRRAVASTPALPWQRLRSVRCRSCPLSVMQLIEGGFGEPLLPAGVAESYGGELLGSGDAGCAVAPGRSQRYPLVGCAVVQLGQRCRSCPRPPGVHPRPRGQRRGVPEPAVGRQGAEQPPLRAIYHLTWLDSTPAPVTQWSGPSPE